MKRLLMMIGAAADLTAKALAAAVSVGAMLPLSAMADAVRVYDVDDYVQDGLILHFDGIRNAGADQPHGPDATTWANLGSLGSSCDATKTVAGQCPSGSAAGAWGSLGYAFGGTEYFTLGAQVTLGAACTTQIRADYNHSNAKSSYPAFFGAIGEDKDTCVIYGAKANTSINFKFRYSSTKYKSVQENPWKSYYLTAAYDAADGRASITSGVEHAWQDVTFSSGFGDDALDFAIGTAQNSDSARSARILYATVHSVRVYNRVLENSELEWNRAVDESRFGGTYGGAGNDVVNVIVASNVEGVEGTEACGKWYIPEGTHAFTAPETRFVDGCGYVLGGYTVETWDGSDWGTAVVNSGASYTASASAKVRLTWLWTKVLRGTADYDVGDYVQDDLLLHFDGIRNVGADAEHNASATVWTNLVAGGSDATKTTLPTANQLSGGADGEWTDNGFVFGGRDYFAIDTALLLGDEVTVQSVIDRDENSTHSGWATVFGATSANADNFGIYFAKNSITDLYFKLFATTAHPMTTDWSAPYMTAIYDNANARISIDDAVEPVWQNAKSGVSGDLAEMTYAIGTGQSSDKNKGDRIFRGTYHALRIYTNVLDNAQLAQNRRVDEARFRGNGDVTIVNGAIGDTGMNGASSLPDGAYNIESGTWTVTAANVPVDGDGVYMPRLLVETWDEATGEWVADTTRPVWTESYTIDKAALGDSRIRLTWTWGKRIGLTISFY